MNNFKVWCETDKERDDVLEYLEHEGIKWSSGDEATKIKYSTPIGLIIDKDELTYASLSQKSYFNGHRCPERKLEEFVKNEPIIIYQNGSKVIALDKNTGKKAEAKCNPADDFDFYTGAKLSFERLTESKNNFKLLCIKSDRQLVTFGKVYKFVNGVTEWDSGKKSSKYKDFDHFERTNISLAMCLIELKDGDDVNELLKKYREIKIDDTVEVIKRVQTFAKYRDWGGLGKWRQNWVENKFPEVGKRYKVLNVANRATYDDTQILLIQDPDTTQVFIIHPDGVEKV